MPRAASAAAADPKRQLMIKTKVCQRLLKEVAHYKQEVKDNESTMEEMKQNGKSDPYDIKRFEQVLGESYMMVPDSTKRLEQALDDLSNFVESNKSEFIACSDEWYPTATELLEKHFDVASTALSDGEQGRDTVPRTDVEDIPEGEAF